MKKGHPDQVRLEAALRGLTADVGPTLPPAGPLSIRLDVALPAHKASTREGHDLDNYLFPVARRLGPRRIVSAWASKRIGATSTFTVDHPTEPVIPDGDWGFRRVRTTASGQTTAWKQQVAHAVTDATCVEGDGGIDLHLSFRLSSRRNWTNQWKPAIDALGSIFGVERPDRPYNARDYRVVLLGLHRFDDDSLSNDIELGIWWRPAKS